MFAGSPIECAGFGCAFDSARGGLVDVDVGDAGVVLVLFDVEGDGGHADCFAEEPAYALEGEDGVEVIGEGFVLRTISCWIVVGGEYSP